MLLGELANSFYLMFIKSSLFVFNLLSIQSGVLTGKKGKKGKGKRELFLSN